jgi:hypothetical protein
VWLVSDSFFISRSEDRPRRPDPAHISLSRSGFGSTGALACGLRFGLGGRDLVLFPARDSHPTSDSVSLAKGFCLPVLSSSKSVVSLLFLLVFVPVVVSSMQTLKFQD